MWIQTALQIKHLSERQLVWPVALPCILSKKKFLLKSSVKVTWVKQQSSLNCNRTLHVRTKQKTNKQTTKTHLCAYCAICLPSCSNHIHKHTTLCWLVVSLPHVAQATLVGSSAEDSESPWQWTCGQGSGHFPVGPPCTPEYSGIKMCTKLQSEMYFWRKTWDQKWR